jgi:hypothetical protein
VARRRPFKAIRRVAGRFVDGMTRFPHSQSWDDDWESHHLNTYMLELSIYYMLEVKGVGLCLVSNQGINISFIKANYIVLVWSECQNVFCP